jgi:hypothetical protein
MVSKSASGTSVYSCQTRMAFENAETAETGVLKGEGNV